LLALTLEQLGLYLTHPDRLEEELGFPMSRAILTQPVQRAIRIKMDKMAQAEESAHSWYTYWLIIVADEPFGAGMAGFKGYPDERGEVEIGYGIDPDWQNKGYMTEAVRAMIAWAFAHSYCRSVIAPGVLKSNPASSRVLEKVGMHIYQETADSLSWRCDKLLIGRQNQEEINEGLANLKAHLEG
jgi:RimJ/RimL family protein N-acetyltransferase